MKGLPTLIRVHQWKLEEMRRNLGELEGLRADLERQLQNLHTQHAEEQRLAAESAEFAFTYNGYANSFMFRREKLHQSIAEVEEALTQARAEVQDAYQEVKKYEIVHERNVRKEYELELRREQVALDEAGLQMHRANAA